MGGCKQLSRASSKMRSACFMVTPSMVPPRQGELCPCMVQQPATPSPCMHGCMDSPAGGHAGAPPAGPMTRWARPERGLLSTAAVLPQRTRPMPRQLPLSATASFPVQHNGLRGRAHSICERPTENGVVLLLATPSSHVQGNSPSSLNTAHVSPAPTHRSEGQQLHASHHICLCSASTIYTATCASNHKGSWESLASGYSMARTAEKPCTFSQSEHVTLSGPLEPRPTRARQNALP